MTDIGEEWIDHIKDERVGLRLCPEKIIYFRRMSNFFIKQFQLAKVKPADPKKPKPNPTIERGEAVTSPQKRRDARMATMGIL